MKKAIGYITERQRWRSQQEEGKGKQSDGEEAKKEGKKKQTASPSTQKK